MTTDREENGMKIRAFVFVFVVAVTLTVAVPMFAQDGEHVDPLSAQGQACEGAINAAIEEEFPKARFLRWDWPSVRQREQDKNQIALWGEASYKGGTDQRRKVTFDCLYNAKKDVVIRASWTSSRDKRVREVEVLEAPNQSTAADRLEACRESLLPVVETEFPSTVSNLSLHQESIELKEGGDDEVEITGTGEFRGGGGTWREFSFRCLYDDSEEKVTEQEWRHLGAKGKES